MSRVFLSGFILVLGAVALSSRLLREHALTPLTPSVSSSIPSSSSMLLGSPTTTDTEWKHILSSETYHIMREAGTERPFSSPLDFETRPGTYVSADCGEPLFRSEQKYDSGTGWPSFWPLSIPPLLPLKKIMIYLRHVQRL
jgi:hypothetical protein